MKGKSRTFKRRSRVHRKEISNSSSFLHAGGYPGKVRDKHIIIGVTGSVAAYKSAELVSRLKQDDADVYVVMTKNATELVGPTTFKALSEILF